jgi:hypothetical protein
LQNFGGLPSWPSGVLIEVHRNPTSVSVVELKWGMTAKRSTRIIFHPRSLIRLASSRVGSFAGGLDDAMGTVGRLSPGVTSKIAGPILPWTVEERRLASSSATAASTRFRVCEDEPLG